MAEVKPIPNQRLRYERERRAWSQLEVADRVGTTPDNVGRWERGVTSPGPHFRQKLCEVFEKNPQELDLVPPQKLGLVPENPYTDKTSIWNVPYKRNLLFTGREEILTQLRTALTSEGQPMALGQPLAISGLGGIGKTQVAVEYAYRYHDDYQFVLWARADTRESLVMEFVAFAHLLQLPEMVAQDQNIAIQAVMRWLETHDRWLLILDSADDLAIVRDFLPAVSRGHVLLTTRAHSTGTIAQRMQIEKLGLGEGMVFLLRRIKRLKGNVELKTMSESVRTQVEAIVEALDGLPLALDQAGAYIEETGCSFMNYLKFFKTRRNRLLRIRGHDTTGHPESVATTWSLSFERVENANPAAAELLQLCAFMYPDAIPEEIITEGAAELSPVLKAAATDFMKFNNAVGELLRYSLVQRNPEAHSLTIHRLVQDVLKNVINEDMKREWAERVVRIVNRIFPNPQEVARWPLCQRYLLQAEACADLIYQWDITSPQAILLLNQAGYYLNERAQFAEAESLMQSALLINEQVLGPNHPDVATNLNNLALLYDDQGKYEQAELLLQRALAIREKVLGSNHPKVATSLNNLATHYYYQGKYQQTESLYQRALSINERILGPKHPGVATNLNNLAELYRIQGNYEQAEPLYQRALAIREKSLDPRHPDVAQSLNNLAGLYIDEGEYEQAEPLYQRALNVFEQTLGSIHPNVATSLNNLAELYRIKGKYEQAESLYQRALTILEQTLGPNHPNVAQSLNNLALLYRNQGKYAQAQHLMQRALSISQQAPAPSHTDLVRNLNNSALLYKSQSKFEQAETFYQRALTIREQKLGSSHPDVAQSLNNLAVLSYQRGKYEQAELLCQRALSIFEQSLGLNHPNLAYSLNNLAVLSYQRGKYEQADLLYQRALSIFEYALGPNHPVMSRILGNYAILLWKMKRNSEATSLQARAKTILMKKQFLN